MHSVIRNAWNYFDTFDKFITQLKRYVILIETHSQAIICLSAQLPLIELQGRCLSHSIHNSDRHQNINLKPA